jgi:hypothetical protein
MTKKQRTDRHKKLFISLYTFEVFDLPVRVQPIESPGNEARRGGVRFVRYQERETGRMLCLRSL